MSAVAALPLLAEEQRVEADVHGYVVKEQLDATDPGARVYLARCASCHDHPQNNIPPRASLVYRSPETVHYALTEGLMKPMAAGLTADEIRELVLLLTGREARPQGDIMANACRKPGARLRIDREDWTTTGGNPGNTRYRDYRWLRADDVRRLKLKWSFGYPGGAPGPVVLGGDRLFLSAGLGYVMSLDASTGCTHWAFRTPGRVVRSVAVAPPTGSQKKAAVYFGDDKANVVALDARSGELLWSTRIEDNVLSRVTGAPSIHNGRVYVPVSSIEDPLTHSPSHKCCTSRGSVAALDAATGKLLWKQYNIVQPPQPLPGGGEGNTPMFGPAGASTYTPLAIDARRNVVYATTAEEYGFLNAAGPYSVIAYDLASGERRWQKQFVPAGADREDACREVGRTDCRNMFSMGTAVLIQKLEKGREILLVGQKSGYVYALDPDAGGRELWRNKVAYGGDLGGIMYGMTSDGERVYVPSSDVDVKLPKRPGTLVALDPATGREFWRREGPEANCSWASTSCTAAQVAALTGIRGAVFAGYTDGRLRAYSTKDGAELLNFDTARPFESVNGVPTHGGQVSGYPVVIGKRAVYVTSGASSVERPGNALLVFTIDGR
jgi:polyvinyl alcohol dehydrogenase (cytochrome)